MAKLNFLKLFGFMLLLLSVPSTLQAQDRVLPGADGAALVQSINVPTNLYTGTANVQVPLCTLETLDGPAINIGLSYQASGIKVEDRETNVGLGWQLTGGGMITRVVRGQPDESGYRATSGQKHGSLITSEVLTSSQFDSYSAENFKFDGEPDIYYFQMPTCSGSFVIDYNGEICLVPYQDIVVNIPSSSTGYFEIIDTSGIKYRLGSTSNSREVKQYKKSDATEWTTYTSSWLLEKILVNERTIAQYSYSLRTDANSYTTSNTIYKYEGGPSNQSPTGYYKILETNDNIINHLESSSKYLSIITTDYGDTVEFVNNGGLLRQINVRKGLGSDYFRVFYFHYGKLNDERRIINEITIGYTANSTTKFLVSFDYHNLNLPVNYKEYVDVYGYYNGPSTKTRRTETSRFVSMHYDSYDRACKIDYAVHGTLKRIIYPTGGYKQLEYEYQGGLRIKRISEYESAAKLANQTEYYYESAVSVGASRYTLLLAISDPPWDSNDKFIYNVFEKPNNNYDGSIVVYSKIKEVFSNGGYNIYRYYTPADFPNICGQKKIYNASAQNEWEDDLDIIIPNTIKSWGQGMAKEIIEYSAEGKKISHTTYNYDLSLPQKKVVKAYKLYVGLHNSPYIASQEKYIGRYQWISQPVRLTSVETLATDYSLPSTTTFTYADNPSSPDMDFPTLVRSTTTTNIQGEILVTTVKYPFDYAQTSSTSSDNQLKALHWMKSWHAINTPIETLIYNPSGGMIRGGELNKFKMKGNSVVLDEKLSLPQKHLPYWQFTHTNVFNSSFRQSDEYKTDMKYYEYTDKLLPSIYRVGDGPIQAVEYGHNGLYPIATFNNAYTEQDLQIGNRIIYLDRLTSPTTIPINWRGSDVQVSYLKKDNDKWIKHQYVLDTSNISQNSALPQVIILATTSSPVRDVVIAPQYTTYSSSTLKPGIGKTSETDVNGVSIYHEYDECGRLAKVLDKDKNVLKETVYGF